MSRREYIGNQIAKARKKKRLSQKTVAEITGIDKASISKIEKGKINATIDTIDKLCNAVETEIRLIEGNYIFESLVFEKHPFHLLADQIGESYPNYEASKTCYQAQMQFANGLHISVLIGSLFYSNGVDTYEVCLWSEDGFQEIFPFLSDSNVSSLMEYAQMVTDIRILHHLQSAGFEFTHKFATLSCIKKHKDWYVLVNPSGKPNISFNKTPSNFENTCFYSGYEALKPVLDDLDKYIEEQNK